MGWHIWPEKDPLGEPLCTFCGKPIKAGTKFYFEGNTKYSHAGCAWKWKTTNPEAYEEWLDEQEQ